MSVLFLLCTVSLNGTIDESHLNKTQSNPKFAIYFGKKAFEGIRGSTQKSLNLFWLSEWEVRRQDHISHPMRGERAAAKGCSWEFSGFVGTSPTANRQHSISPSASQQAVQKQIDAPEIRPSSSVSPGVREENTRSCAVNVQGIGLS